LGTTVQNLIGDYSDLN